ncbi:gluconolactonase [Niastella vici]|uniref:Gluconolactonase n=1 Tax=Niastella vici TaxID=1703345 RepID=A0A1V9FLC2_9BACT|nr:SMP-30/gluconolactonase/LRE family protein [Niastella vici]OQP59097.1 gluconolactonase [Niastella vici]
MHKFFITATAIVLVTACQRKANPQKDFSKSLFRAVDQTAENLFTKNCEGPAVDKDDRLFVVNYQTDGTIGLVHPDGQVELFVTLPGKSVGNSIRFNAQGHMLVADFVEHNVLEVDPETKAVSVYCHEDRFNQPNDICISKKGIVYASDPNWQKQTGQIWKIGKDRKAVLLKGNLGTTNGICLSPDEKTLYVNESIQRKVWAFELDDKGDIKSERTFATFTDFGMDGMKCDTKGNLYITRHGKGTVAIFNSGGRQIQEVELKGKDVSNITFGGKDGRTCFVTLQDRKCIEKFRTDIEGRQ